MPKKTILIQVKRDTAKALKKLVKGDRITYDQVITYLLEKNQENE